MARFSHQKNAAHRDESLMLLAERQHGAASIEQMIALGFSRATLYRRIRNKQFRMVHPGVVALGYAALGERGRCMAATLAVSAPSAVTGLAAAWLLKITDKCPKTIDVATGTRHCCARGAKVHRSSNFDLMRCRRIDGIRVVPLEEVLLSLACQMRAPSLAHVLHQAAHRGLLDTSRLEVCIARWRCRPGVRVLRRALLLHTRGSAGFRSRSEARAAELLQDIGSPRYRMNTVIETRSRPVETDFLWRRLRLVIEIDGPQHDTESGRREDALRDAALGDIGFSVIRIPTRDVWRRPGHVRAVMRGAIARAGGRFRRSRV